MSPTSSSSAASSSARHVIPTPAGGQSMDAFKTPMPPPLPAPSASAAPTAASRTPAPQGWKPRQAGSAGAQNPLLGGHRARPAPPQSSAASAPLLSAPKAPVPLLDAAPPQHWHHRGTLKCQMNVLGAHRQPPPPAAPSSSATSAPTAAGLLN